MSYTFILVTIIFELVFSQPDVNNRFFFSDAAKRDSTIGIIRQIFNLFPSFPISICFGALLKRASTHLDQQVFAWVEGDKFSWADFNRDIQGKLADGVIYTMPSPMKSMGILF